MEVDEPGCSQPQAEAAEGQQELPPPQKLLQEEAAVRPPTVAQDTPTPFC